MTSLRKRHQQAPQSGPFPSSSSSSLTSSRRVPLKRRNYGEMAFYVAIFLSSPLFLLIVVWRSQHHHQDTRHLGTPLNKPDAVVVVDPQDVPYFKQQQQQQAKLLRTSREEDAHHQDAPISGIQDHIVTRVRLNNTTNEDIPTISVVVWPYIDYGAGTAELRHFGENGIEESLYLQMEMDVLNVTPDNHNHIVWIGDFGFHTFSASKWCSVFHEKILEVRKRRHELNLSLAWPIFIVDWSDQTKAPSCPQIEETMGREWVNYYIRNVITSRRWNDTTQWVDVGYKRDLSSFQQEQYYHHVPLFVRTDTVQALDTVLREKYNMNLASPIERLADRNVDVSHFWPCDEIGVKETRHAKLRHQVSSVIAELGNSSSLHVFVGLAGSALQAGRRNVKEEYIEAMLHSKIVVVSQRDDWEDHYRLFEAL